MNTDKAWKPFIEVMYAVLRGLHAFSMFTVLWFMYRIYFLMAMTRGR